MKNVTLENNPVVEKPWGQYEVLTQGAYYLVKRLTVRPGEGTSLQYHQHRAEHLVVVAGQSTVQIEKLKIMVGTGGQFLIERGTTHQIVNAGQVDLVIIETQIGDIVDEEDIVRVQDPYGR